MFDSFKCRLKEVYSNNGLHRLYFRGLCPGKPCEYLRMIKETDSFVTFSTCYARSIWRRRLPGEHKGRRELVQSMHLGIVKQMADSDNENLPNKQGNDAKRTIPPWADGKNLRNVERDVLIPKIMREKAKVKCKDLVDGNVSILYLKCCSYGLICSKCSIISGLSAKKHTSRNHYS